MFKGTTLRGMLLNAYGFWKMGQIAWIAAIVAFAGAALMLILSFARAVAPAHGSRGEGSVRQGRPPGQGPDGLTVWSA